MRRSSANAEQPILPLFTLALIAFVAMGCASLIKGPDQSVTFTSDPSEAILVITDLRDGKDIHIGTTPFTASLKRGAGYFKSAKFKIMIEKPGYRREDILLEGTPNGWYLAGNIVFGWPIGWLIVDPLTGAMWTLDPEGINVTLKKQGAFLPRDEGLTVVRRDSVPAEVEAKMKPLRAPYEK